MSALAAIRLTCDGCGAEEEVDELDTLGLRSPRAARQVAALRHGWTRQRSRDLCFQCTLRAEEVIG